MSLKTYKRGVVGAIATTALTLMVGLLPLGGGSASGATGLAAATTSTSTTTPPPSDSSSVQSTKTATSTPTPKPTTPPGPQALAATAYGAPGQTRIVNVLAHDSCAGSTTAPCPWSSLVGSRLAVSGSPAVPGVVASVVPTNGNVSIAVASSVTPGTAATFTYTIHDQYGTASNAITLNIGHAPVTPHIGKSFYSGKSLTFNLMDATKCDDLQAPCPSAALSHIFIGKDKRNPLVTATATTAGMVTIKIDPKQPQFAVAHIPYSLVDRYGQSQGLLVVTVLDPWNPKTGIIFNNPLGGLAQQHFIDKHIIDLTNHAPKGATIQLITYTLDGTDLTYALVNAYKRGVNVRVLQGQGIISGNVPYLQQNLGTNAYANSFYHLCHAACRSGSTGVPHSKVFELTRSGIASNIVLAASSNYSYGGSSFQWFDAYQLVNNSAAFQGFAHVFAESRRDTMPADWTGLTYKVSSAITYIYPRLVRSASEMAGTPPKPIIAPVLAGNARDWLGQALSQIGCNASSGYGKNGRTLVRVSVRALQGARGYDIAHQLGLLAKAGCDVRVITTQPSTDAVSALQQAGIWVGDQTWRWKFQPCAYDNGVPSNAKCWVPGLYTHMHALAVSGNYGNKQQDVVWTGSESWNTDGFYNDEQVVRLVGQAPFNSYNTVFNYNWAHYTHAFGLRPAGDPPYAPVTYP